MDLRRVALAGQRLLALGSGSRCPICYQSLGATTRTDHHRRRAPRSPIATRSRHSWAAWPRVRPPSMNPTEPTQPAGDLVLPAVPPAKKQEKSYLYSAVETLNPWKAQSTTPTDGSSSRPLQASASSAPTGTADHTQRRLYGRSSRTYPLDCPALQVQWFHAVDVRRPDRMARRGLMCLLVGPRAPLTRLLSPPFPPGSQAQAKSQAYQEATPGSSARLTTQEIRSLCTTRLPCH